MNRSLLEPEGVDMKEEETVTRDCEPPRENRRRAPVGRKTISIDELRNRGVDVYDVVNEPAWTATETRFPPSGIEIVIHVGRRYPLL